MAGKVGNGELFVYIRARLEGIYSGNLFLSWISRLIKCIESLLDKGHATITSVHHLIHYVQVCIGLVEHFILTCTFRWMMRSGEPSSCR